MSDPGSPPKLTQKQVLEQLSMTPVPKPPNHITKLPGVNYQTVAAGFANLGPTDKWRKRAGRMVNVMWNAKTQADFAPYIKEAQAWLQDACMQLALASGGVCGPIEANALATAAWQTAYARFWMAKAAEDPSNMSLFQVASKVADSARQNALAAYDIAARLAKTRGQADGDPLSAFLDVTAPNPSLQSSSSPRSPKGSFADDDEDS